MVVVKANQHNDAANLQATLNACAPRGRPVNDTTRAARLPAQLFQLDHVVIIPELINKDLARGWDATLGHGEFRFRSAFDASQRPTYSCLLDNEARTNAETHLLARG